MPYYQFQCTTSLSPEEALEQIRLQTHEPRNYWDALTYGWLCDVWDSIAYNVPDGLRRALKLPEHSYLPFVGSVSGGCFQFSRVLYQHVLTFRQWRRSVATMIIRGQITSSGNGAGVTVVMTIHPLPILLILVVVCCLGVISSNAHAGGIRIDFLTKFFLVVVAIRCVHFFIEAPQVRRLIEAAVNGEFGADG